MELTFAQQSTAFLCSLVFGAAAGLLYDIFKIIRMTLCKGKASVFVTDFLYVFIVSLNLFIFSVAYMLGFFRVFVTVGLFVVLQPNKVNNIKIHIPMEIIVLIILFIVSLANI